MKKKYLFAHLPSGFKWELEEVQSIVTWAANGDKYIQDKLRARMYRAVADLDDRARRRQIQQDYDEFLWTDIDIAYGV